MARKRSTPEQIVAILREAERGTVRHKRRPEDPLNGLIRKELKSLSGKHRRWGTPRMTEWKRSMSS